MKFLSQLQRRLAPSKPDQQVDFSDLEADLQAVLQPVEPRPDYVDNLHQRLNQAYSQQMLVMEEDLAVRRAQSLLFGALGVLSLSMALFASMRFLIAVLSSIGLLVHVSQETRQKKARRALKATV